MILFRSFCACSVRRRRAGRHDVRRLLRGGRPDDRTTCAEAAELEVLGDVHRLRQADEHAFVLLEGVGGRDRERDVGRRDRAGAAVGDRADR